MITGIIAGAVAALVAVLAAWRAGRKTAHTQTALEAAEAYAKTTKDADNAPDFGNDDDYARRVMRERDADQP